MSILPTPNLMLINMVPGASAVAGNVWPNNENISRQLCDDVLSGVMAVATTGATTTFNGGPSVPTPGGIIVPTSISGQSDQSRQRLFKVTGASTVSTISEITLLMPPGLTRPFSVQNGITGFIAGTSTPLPLVVGVSNGAGGVFGATVVIPQGSQLGLVSDGSNILLDSRIGMTRLQSVFVKNTTPQNFNSATPAAFISQSFTPNSAQSIIIISCTLDYECQITNGSANKSAIMLASIARSGTDLLSYLLGGSVFAAAPGSVVITPAGNGSLVWQENSPGTSAVTYALNASNLGTLGLTNQIIEATMKIEELL